MNESIESIENDSFDSFDSSFDDSIDSIHSNEARATAGGRRKDLCTPAFRQYYMYSYSQSKDSVLYLEVMPK